MSHRYVVVDLETTGNAHTRGDRIIQISAVIIEQFKIVDQYTTFVNPGVAIPPFIEELTGIHDGMVKDAPSFIEIAGDIYKLLHDSVFVAHNVPFDLNFLSNELTDAGYPNVFSEAVDTVELAKILMPEAASYKLTELSDLFNLDHENPHQADSDALVTAELFLMLIDKAKDLPLVTLEKLSELAFYLKSNISSLLTVILQEKRRKIENLDENLEVYRGIALRKKTIQHTREDTSFAKYPLMKEDKFQLLAEYQLKSREGQMLMMDMIYEAFSTKKHAVIEAGTGIGKSLAYLFPALHFAVEHDQPVIISTFTIQMQDQLMNNEIKRLAKMLPFPFRASILKGRGNYLHLLKFEQSLYERDSHYDTAMTKMQILVWLIFTKTGDLDELNLSSGGQLFKERIKHDGWFFQKEKDPWFSRDFYVYARKRAENADLVITNHSMLLLDSEKESHLLPDYQYVVIDEAHNFEKAARQSLGKKLTYPSVKFWLGRLGTIDKKQLLYRLEQLIDRMDIQPSVHLFELNHSIIQLEAEIDDLFLLFGSLINKHNLNKTTKNTKSQIRITNAMKEEPKWAPILMCTERVYDIHRSIANGIKELLQLIKDHSKTPSESDHAFLEEMNGFVKEWQLIGQKIRSFILRPQAEEVMWLEGDLKALPNSITVYSQPENIGPLLSTRFFQQKESVVMTSATLTVNRSFSFFKDAVGIEDGVLEKIIDSPFDYRKMAKLMIPTDLPEIRGKGNDEYIEAIANHLIGIANATDGRMLVLFTSYDMLRKTYYLIKDTGALDDFIMLAQGVTTGSRSRLTKSFQQFNKAILFGTNSFWEGVDIPGKDLSCLVIVRLPFSPPDEPITEAKYETLKQSGKSPFSTYSLPEAIIRFKQGFGRLIRDETDRGVVIVFDRRIDTSTYGKEFVRSIPEVEVERGNLMEIINTIEEWL